MPRHTPDAELQALFADDRELLELTELIRDARPEPRVDPRFKHVLRARLMEAAEHDLRPGRIRSLLHLPGRYAAFAMGAAGTAAFAAAVVILLHGPSTNTVPLGPVANSPIQGDSAVNPGEVITVAFNQPMDQRTVLAGLGIHPATSYTAAWSGNTLTITPAHRLAVNTPYRVTINHAVARNAHGVAPAGDIQISFGTVTGPVPTPTGPPLPPALALHAIGSADPGAALVYAPDGRVLITSRTTPASGGATPSASGGAVSPSASATASPPASRLVEQRPDGTWAVLGPATGALAFSSSGNQMAFIVPNSGAPGGKVTVAAADGSHPVALANTDTASSPIAWGGTDTVDYVSGGRLRGVDLQGSSHTLAPATLSPGESVVFAPGGRHVFLGAPVTTPGSPVGSPAASAGSGSGTDGVLLDISTLTSVPLTGSRTPATFSADGSTVAWLDQSGSSPRLAAAPTSGGAPTTVATLSKTAVVIGLALSTDGKRLADVTPDAVFVRTVATGAEVAESNSGGRAVVCNPADTAVGVLRHQGGGDEVAQADLPRGTATGTGPASDVVPPAAEAVINALADAQVKHDRRLLAGALSADVDPAPLLPEGVSRGYVIGMTTTDATGIVHGTVRLIADGTGSHTPARAATESVEVGRPEAGKPYRVTSVALGDLVAVTAGPQVIHLEQSTAGPTTTFAISWDSDLDAATVRGAVSVRTRGGTRVEPVVHYDADTRTIEVAAASTPGDPLQATVGTALRDVDGESLASAYVTPAGG